MCYVRSAQNFREKIPRFEGKVYFWDEVKSTAVRRPSKRLDGWLNLIERVLSWLKSTSTDSPCIELRHATRGKTPTPTFRLCVCVGKFEFRTPILSTGGERERYLVLYQVHFSSTTARVPEQRITVLCRSSERCKTQTHPTYILLLVALRKHTIGRTHEKQTKSFIVSAIKLLCVFVSHYYDTFLFFWWFPWDNSTTIDRASYERHDHTLAFLLI